MPKFPNQFAIINDPSFGKSIVEPDGDTEVIKSKKVGPTLANANNNGDCNAFLTGTPTLNKKYEFRCQDGGGMEVGSFAWKFKSETDTFWKGENDQRLPKNITNPLGDGVLARSTSYIYIPLYNREVIYASTESKTRLEVRYRTYSPTNDVGTGEAWTESAIVFGAFGTQDAGIYYNARRKNYKSFDVCILDNGDILLAVINNNDIDIYRSKDGLVFEPSINGLNTDLVSGSGASSRRIFHNIEIKSSGNYVSILTSCQLAYTEFVTDVTFQSYFSSDGGSTWFRRSPSAVDSLKFPSSFEEIPYDNEAGEIWTHGPLDSEGTFILINTQAGFESELVMGVSRGGSPFEILTGANFTGQYISKPAIVLAHDAVYIYLYALSELPRKLVTQNPFEIKRQNFELFRARLSKSSYMIGDPIKFFPWSSSSGAGYYFIRDMTAFQLPNSSICISGITMNRYADRNAGISYFRLGGWDTYPVRSFNYENQTNNSRISNAQFANFSGSNNITQLFDINWFAHYGMPAGGGDSNSFLLNGQDPSLFEEIHDISFVRWMQDHIEFADGFDTVGSTKTGCMFRFIYQTGHANGNDLEYVKNIGALTNYHIEILEDVIGFDDGYKTDAPSAISNFAFIPFLTRNSTTLHQGGDPEVDYNDILASNPHGGCLQFICKTNAYATTNGEDSNIVAGVCTYLAASHSDHNADNTGYGSAGVTKILNLRIAIGTGSIDLLDCNRYDSSGVQTPVRVGRITIGSADLASNYYEVRCGIHPSTENPIDPRVFFMARKMNDHTWIKQDGITFITTTADTNIVDKFYTNVHPNHDSGSPVLNQMAYFGHINGTNALAGAEVESFWKQFAFKSGNDLNTLSYSGISSPPVDSLNTYTRLPGAIISPFPVPIHDNLKAVFGGSGLVVGDLYESDIDHDYAPQNIPSYNSPRIAFETNSVNASSAGNSISLIFSTINDESMYLDSVAAFNSRAKNIKFSYSLDGTTYNTVAGTNDDYLDFDTGLTGSVQEINHNVISVRWSDSSYYKIRNGIFNSSDKNKWIFYKGLSPSATGTTWENSGIAYEIERTIQTGTITRSDGITKNESNIILSTEGASSYFPIAGTTNATFVVGSTFNIYASRAYTTNFSHYAKVCKKMKVEITGFEYGDENTMRIGTLVTGTTVTFNPLLDWEVKDTETPNQDFNNTRSGLNWVYNKGPSVRTLDMSLTGDVNEQLRYEFRNTLNSVTKYAKNPIALIVGSAELQSNQGDLYEDVVLTRYDGNTQLNNVGWTYDELATNWKPVGTMSIKFTEIV